MKVVGVNGKKFTANRLRDALADSIARKNVEFLLEEGDEFRTIAVPYAEGLRYLELVRVDGKPDVLGEILKSTRSERSRTYKDQVAASFNSACQANLVIEPKVSDGAKLQASAPGVFRIT